MIQSRHARWLVALLGLISTFACQLLSSSPADPTPDAGIIGTAAALTVEAQFTRSAPAAAATTAASPTASIATLQPATTAPTPKIPDTCGRSQPTRLSIDSLAEVVVFQLNIRLEPGLAAERLDVLARDRVIIMLEGPRCVDDLWWWRVRNDDLALEGWVVESDETNYFLSPSND